MVTLEQLYKEADDKQLTIHEKPMSDRFKGLIYENQIMLNGKMTNSEKITVLCEEITHYEFDTGELIDQSEIVNRKKEKSTRGKVYEKVITPDMFINAFNDRISSLFELSEYWGLPEPFVEEAIEHYRNKYGYYIKHKNYYIHFIPTLVVVKILNMT